MIMKKCKLVPYGDEEKRCVNCGYITWVDDSKPDFEIISDMVTLGYSIPKCIIDLTPTQKREI